ncbi:mitochondrial import inner membrane translocase subunit Tim10-like [Mercenaria mercenaria]|uniref:mitochondrial import inner membrane translocase subunit Tim10-like n=1 Tax=Mercenaria mercenaria TaxID=6596 RepID=UPI001E1D678A|nr:mitochondrial import inner membrane translocase subunit Tim10-like [Mercenaria mercenaria]
MAKISEDQQKVLSQMEELLIETFNTVKRTCSEKCLNHKYDQTNLVKNEAVCMDRCVAKYMELHDLIGRRISRDKETYDLLARPPYQTSLEDTEAFKLKQKVEKEQTG